MSLRNGVRLVSGLLVVLVLTFAYQAWRATSAFLHARDQGTELTGQLSSGDLSGAKRTAAELASSTHAARTHTDGILWDLGSHLPLVGRNVGAVQVSAEVLDAVSQRSLPVLLDLAGQAQSGALRPRNGRLDIAAIERLAPAVRRAADGVRGPAARMRTVEADRLVYPLDDIIGELQTRVGQADTAIGSAADAFAVLPDMLGDTGPRRYLLLVHNNAEIRATGGMPGSWAILRADRGRLTMGRQGGPNDLGVAARPPVRLTPEEVNLFGVGFNRDLRDTAFTPDFPREAQSAAGLIRAKFGTVVDTVFAIDPVSMGLVLQGTGPVRIAPNAVVNSANVVPFLLNTVYRTVLDAEAQNTFYEVTARKVFDAMVGGQGDQVRVVRGLVTAVAQRRLLAWSERPQLAKIIDGRQLSGAVPTDTGSTPHLGVYLNDSMGGKMDFYLRFSSIVRSTACSPTGVQSLSMQTTFTAQTPPGIKKYSWFVTGLGIDTPRGETRINARVFAPYDGTIDSLKLDGTPLTYRSGTYKGRPVAIVPILLKPGQSQTLSTQFSTGKGQSGRTVLTSTPGMMPATNPVEVASSCR